MFSYEMYVHLSEESEQPEHDLLSPINQSQMIGSEKMILDLHDVQAYEADYKHSTMRSIRFVKIIDGKIVGALQFRTLGPKSKKGIIQNVRVDSKHRRNKIATELLRAARAYYTVKHSDDLTTDGKAWKASLSEKHEDTIMTEELARCLKLAGMNEALESKCLTPDSTYNIKTSPSGISASVKFPNEVELPEDDAKQLELNIDNALELALAVFLKKAE